LLYLRDTLGYLAHCSRTYGDPFTLRILNGTCVMTGDPELARRIFTADPALFAPAATDSVKFLLGEASIGMVGGERHARDRKLLAPPFHGARMRAYGRIIADATVREIDGLPRGTEIKAQDSAQAISLEVILEAVFGLSDPERRAGMGQAVHGMMGSPWGALLVMLPVLQRDFGGFGPWASFQRVKGAFDAMVRAEIAERRRTGSTGEDILHMMMGARYDDGSALSEDELRDQLVFLLIAGHETSAISLAWALYELHRHPPALDRLRAELDALGPAPGPDAFTELPYLDAVCHEVLRLHPLLGYVPRVLREPFELGGHTIPGGLAVGVSIPLVHAREDVYPDAGRFRPERFLERKFTPFEFVPFGGGSRRCLGAAFALFEMKVVLATILRGYRLTLLETGPVRHVSRSITLGAETGIRMRVEERRPLPAAAAA
jgi:cytochrome P450